jgi:hypothetical protein
MLPSNFDSQIAAFLSRLPYEAEPTLAANEPQVIFRGALELDRDQEAALVQSTMTRIGELETELGRGDVDEGAIQWGNVLGMSEAGATN